MKYSAFASDVLCHGAEFACRYAQSCGVSGPVVAAWLRRLASKSAGRVLAALRAWHAAARALPLIDVTFDSGPIECLPLVIRPALVLIQGGKAA